MSLAVRHVPVLLAEVAGFAEGRSRIVDATAGGGGHLQAFWEMGAEVVAFDRDAHAIAQLSEQFDDRVTLHNLAFGSPAALEIIAQFTPQFIFLDLGVSSQQIDDPDRGFTFRSGAMLDMRMDGDGPSAADLLNTASPHELRQAFSEYADERRARPLASEIVRRRANQPFATSDDLVNAIRAVLGSRAGPSDFARLFQAVRIAVNQELQQLAHALPLMREALEPGGLLAVVSYHSGEDRIVKHTFREWARSCVCPPAFPVCACRGAALGTIVTKSPISPTATEITRNPRARSAKLRVFRKVS